MAPSAVGCYPNLMNQMQLSPTFISFIQAAYKEQGIVWLRQLPTQLERLAKRWNFRLLKTVTNLTFSFVGIVELQENGERAILKVVPKGGRVIEEAHWLQCVKSGVPIVFQMDEEEPAVLMEYLEPGHSLKKLVQTGSDDKATRIICQMILALQSQQQKTYPFKHLSELIKDLDHLKGHIDSSILSKAQSWFQDLTIDHSNDVLLHGDLHHENILAHHDGWKVIDPHGYRGDPAAEIGAMVRNPWDCFPTEHSMPKIIERRLKILAEELPFDRERMKAWAFCMAVLSEAWHIQDFGIDAKIDLDMIAAIEKVKL